MLQCKKCHRDIPDESIYCMYCGRKQIVERRTAKLPNGCGTAYKRGKTWTCKVIMGWRTAEDGHKIPDTRTKGGFATRKEAIQYAPILSRKIIAPTASKLFCEIYDEWLAKYKTRNRDSSTIAGYVSAFKHYKRIHHVKIADVNANMLQDCIDDCPRGKRTKQLMKVVASLVMKYAMDSRMIATNPAENLYCGDQKVGHRPPITEEELEAIHQAIGIEEYAEYVYCLCYLGFRPTEFLELKKSSLHKEGDILYLVGGEKTEAGINRQVTLPPKIVPIIQNRYAVSGTDLLFPRIKKNRKGEFVGYIQMNESYFREQIFKPMMERLGISPDKTPYSARHTYANKLKNISAPDKDKASLIGHTDYETTKRFYQSTNLADRKAITDKM